MAWVEITGEAEASGRLARIYAAARERAGRVANILKVQSQNPASLRSGVALYRDAMFGASPLTRAQREMLAVVVSAANNCDYWVAAHTRDLRAEVHDDDWVAAIARDYTAAELSPADRALCAYAAKLTKTPAAMDRQDIERLRGVGLDDRAIVDAAQVIAYFNYINRIADGLGVDPEPPTRPRG